MINNRKKAQKPRERGEEFSTEKPDKEPFYTAHGSAQQKGGGRTAPTLPIFVAEGARRSASPARGVSQVQVTEEERRAAMGILSRLLALDDALGRLGDNIAR